MKSTDVIEFARQLRAAHGDKAEAEAARKAAALDAEGKADEAETWRKVRIAVRDMRPPHES